MTKEEEHEYFGFDRFMQVAGTKYESELLEIEKKYYNKEINDDEFQELWTNIISNLYEDE